MLVKYITSIPTAIPDATAALERFLLLKKQETEVVVLLQQLHMVQN